MMLAVTTYYWKDPERQKGRDYEFTHEHVRILKRMVERNLSVPHKFLCVTDDDMEGIDTVPLVWDKHVPGTCFIRLQQRHPDYGNMVGADRVLNLDIDVVVVGNLDSLVTRPEPNLWFRNPNFPKPRRAPYQTSIQILTPGTHTELYTEFDPVRSPSLATRRFGGAEQAWVSEILPWNLPAPHLNNFDAFLDAQDGLYGAMRLKGAGVSDTLPENAKIVTFPGNRMPDDEDLMEAMPWIREHYK
jgi:hypothetical protein